MLTAAARSFLITTSLICSAALLSACGGDTTHEEEHHHSESSSSSTEPVHSSSSEAPRNRPNAFSFEDQDDVEPGSEITSETLVIEGLDDPAEIEISGGYYAFGAAEDDHFTDQPGEIGVKERLTLRAEAPDNGSQVHEVEVTIAGVSSIWRLSTPEDHDAPEAAFAFPTPMSATDADTLTLRGTASDELSQIDSVTLTVESAGSTEVYTAESDDGFATWTIEVTLAPGDNNIQLATEDVLGNADDDIARITVRQQSFDLAFPDNEEPFADIRDMTFDVENDRILIGGLDGRFQFGRRGTVVAIDLQTGERTLFAGGESSEDLLDIHSVESVEMDYKRDRLVVGTLNGELIVIDLKSGERTLLAGSGVPSNSEPTLERPEDILLDPEDDDYAYVVSSSGGHLIRLDLDSGEGRVVSSHEQTNAEVSRFPIGVVIGPDNRSAYINNYRQPSLFKVDLETGASVVLDMEEYPDTWGFDSRVTDLVSTSDRSQFYLAGQMEGVVLYDIAGATWEVILDFTESDHPLFWMYSYLALDENNQRIFLADNRSDSLIALDIETQEYVVVSKSVDEEDD